MLRSYLTFTIHRQFLYTLSLFLSLSASTPLPAHADTTPAIRIGIIDNKPMCYLDDTGKPAGIFVDVINYVVKLHLIVREALKLLRSTIPKSIDIQADIAAVGSVLADPTQMHQIIMNLGTNAYHAMRQGGGDFKVALSSTEISPEDQKVGSLDLDPGSYLQLSISDTGHGMDQATVKGIFEPYFTTKDTGEGTGLGLAVVHGIVKSHQGHISVYSEVGRGTRFNIYLPCFEIDWLFTAIFAQEKNRHQH